jgi:hypothetical protein
MLYLDEDTRHSFHQAGTLLQIMVSILEFECAKFHGQLECIGCEEQTALIAVEGVSFNLLSQMCELVNKQFKRKDGAYSCKISEQRQGLVICKASDLKEYIELT